MKSRQSLLLISVVVFFTLTAVAFPCSSWGANNAYSWSIYNRFFTHYIAADTTPKKGEAGELLKEISSDAAKKAADNILKKKGINYEIPKEAKDKKFFEKILSLFKFRKNSQKKEEDRIVGVLNKLKIRDTIVEATASLQKEITGLINELSDREKADFDSLLAIIGKLRSDTSYRSDFRDFINAINQRLDGDTSKSPPPFISGSFVTDKDILDATGNFIPLLEQRNQEAAKLKAKREALSALGKLRTRSSDTVHISSEDKKSIKIYKLGVKTRAEVIGLHNYTLNNDIDAYKYDYLNTIVYQSLYINEKTGSFKSLNGWDTAAIVTRAKARNLKVMFTVAAGDGNNIHKVLTDPKLQAHLVNSILIGLEMRKADGVNIDFKDLLSADGDLFTDFIKRLHETLQKSNPLYQILITVPSYNKSEIFDIKALEAFVDRFLIDFTHTPSSMGALAPLNGPSVYTMENSIAYYTSSMEVPLNKVIVTVPYSGIRWPVRNKKLSTTPLSLMTYSQIRDTYKNVSVNYDKESGNAIIDALENKYRTVRVIYDDQNSLEKKYDFILENGLRGVALNALAYDSGYGELWDALAYKFAMIDSTLIKDSLIAGTPSLNLSWLDKIQRRLSLYWYIVNNPCKVCFDDIKDPAYAVKLNKYLTELKIDSLITAENKKLSPEEQYKSRFEYINYELTNILFTTTIVLFVLCLLICGFYIYQIKVNSTEWKLKKKVQLAMAASIIVFVISLFSYLFCDDTIPIFGSAPAVGKNMHFITADQSTTYPTTVTYTGSCDTEINDTCINMPLYTLMAIIMAGIFIGFLITRYIILLFIKRDDIP